MCLNIMESQENNCLEGYMPPFLKLSSAHAQEISLGIQNDMHKLIYIWEMSFSDCIRAIGYA